MFRGPKYCFCCLPSLRGPTAGRFPIVHRRLGPRRAAHMHPRGGPASRWRSTCRPPCAPTKRWPALWRTRCHATRSFGRGLVSTSSTAYANTANAWTTWGIIASPILLQHAAPRHVRLRTPQRQLRWPWGAAKPPGAAGPRGPPTRRPRRRAPCATHRPRRLRQKKKERGCLEGNAAPRG